MHASGNATVAAGRVGAIPGVIVICRAVRCGLRGSGQTITATPYRCVVYGGRAEVSHLVGSTLLSKDGAVSAAVLRGRRRGLFIERDEASIQALLRGSATSKGLPRGRAVASVLDGRGAAISGARIARRHAGCPALRSETSLALASISRVTTATIGAV